MDMWGSDMSSHFSVHRLGSYICKSRRDLKRDPPKFPEKILRDKMEGEYANSQFDQCREGKMEAEVGCSRSAIDSSNIGFQLLKKCGWKEGTGLGASEQGRLEPIETRVKNNKCGLGADRKRKKPEVHNDPPNPKVNEPKKSMKKAKLVTKRLTKLQEEEKRLQEKEFERDFFRMFWPDNV